jgi:deoxyribodipyrimidine photo-lyase
MRYKLSLFIFHRSLRLNDNIGLINCLNESELVIPCFIFTPEQIGEENRFRSMNAIYFMISALEDLNESLKKYDSKMFFFKGSPEEQLDKILTKHPDIQAVYCNMDYTAYAVEREQKMIRCCEIHGIDFNSYEDYLLRPVGDITNGSGSYYSKFTPFYNKAINYKINRPLANNRKNYVNISFKMRDSLTANKLDEMKREFNVTPDNIFIGNRKEALKKLMLIKNQKKYGDTRNDLSGETTRLSPYIKFGLLSIREVYWKIHDTFGISHDLIKQLFWREFYQIISYNRLDVFNGKSFKEQYDKIKWKNNVKLLNLWKNGMTGFPIVDAGMRELNQTGYMHNRSRLITSNFLVKLLHIDWKKGEEYYASKLTDYDPSVNNGNWQWSAGSGADSQPYFRIFNPWLQSERFDNEGEYIKKWIPELQDVLSDHLHHWDKHYSEYSTTYPQPCIDYETAKKNTLPLYETIYK